MNIDVLDLCIKDLTRRNDVPTFIQIGAHDGVTLDPIYPYATVHQWHGVAVEPQPALFEKLSVNYADFRRVKTEQAVICEQDGEKELWMFAPTADLPYHATMLASLNRVALTNNGHGYKGEVVSIKVPSLSPASLMKRHGLEKVDVLQVDTEGWDCIIILEFFKACIFPTLIHFESALCCDPAKGDLWRLFDEHGYRVMTLGIDTVAYRQGDTGSFKERMSFQ